jgi:hypothetical protein
MRRTQESGAYLGGIGAMLEQADTCPSCGKAHSEHQFGFRHGAARECPSVVMGSFPVFTAPEDEEIPEPIPIPAPVSVSPAPRRVPASIAWETPVSLGSLPSPRREVEFRSRSMAGLWLPPPDLGEVL